MANTKFGTMVRPVKKVNKSEITSENLEDYTFIGQKDRRMRFNTARDPIYYVFDVIENRPVKTLAKEFVKDSFFEIANFVTQVVR